MLETYQSSPSSPCFSCDDHLMVVSILLLLDCHFASGGGEDLVICAERRGKQEKAWKEAET